MHIWIHVKTYESGCTKRCPVKKFLYIIHIWIYIHTSEFIYEIMYENIFYEFIYELTYEFVYMNTQNMNSYMNSCTNKHNMAIRVFQIWRSGCSRSERRRRLWLWRRIGAVAVASHWVSEAGCGEQRRAAPPRRHSNSGRAPLSVPKLKKISVQVFSFRWF